ncbi:uncharacterized protein isoform X1 [Leptinotarsa decemlineata]|uniref:uncharacterized protein isoform X1 n=2 Tax=Leptinotarsa decemlineata TaxID=7539 RepID=UPI003D3061CA
MRFENSVVAMNQMRTIEMLAFLLLLNLTYFSDAAVNPGQICSEDKTSKNPIFSIPGHDVICEGSLPENDRLGLPNQYNKERLDRRSLQLIAVEGVLHKHSLDLFPNVRTVFIYKSDIKNFTSILKIGTALHIAESKFPDITSDTFTENRYFTTLGLHSNPNHTVHVGGFKRLWLLRVLIIYNQTLTTLQDGFLTGLQKELRELILNRNNLSVIQDNAFKSMENLRLINLDYNPLKSFNPKLHYLKRIESISLAHTILFKLGMRLFYPVRNLRSIELPTTALSAMEETDLIQMAIVFPNLKCIHYNSLEDITTPLGPLLHKMDAMGLNVTDSMKLNSATSTLYENSSYQTCEPSWTFHK